MYTVDNYISTSTEDARINLKLTLESDPAKAKRIALAVLKKIEGKSGQLTRTAVMRTTVRQADKKLQGVQS